MILMSILLVTLAALILFLIFILGSGCSIFLIVFADVIVCIIVIVMLIRHFIKK